MRQNRDIINKKLIPEISKSLGKSAMSYRLGGSFATSYNSSDVNDFDKKDEGEIEIIDPKRSYLTTTLYPTNYKDSLSIQLAEQISGRFTDNLYGSLGDVENYSMVKGTKLTGIFKVALKEYFMVKLAQNYIDNSVKIKGVSITGILRDVLKKYTIYPDYSKDYITTKATNLTATMRSVLIRYAFWAAENVKIQPKTLTVSSIVLDGAFESYVPFDALDRIVDEDVPSHSEIEDKASVTWSKTGSPIVQNNVAKEGKYSLYLDGNGSSIKSQESLEYVPSDNESLIIENWLKPDHMVTSLLTRYGGTNSEKGLYYDYAQNTNWTGTNANTNATGRDYLFTNQSQFLDSSNATALLLKIASNNPNGQTLEMNVQVSSGNTVNTQILLSNKNANWLQSPTGNSAALVWYSPTNPNATIAGKVALLVDNTTNTNAANGIMLISSRSFPDDSVLQIALVTYGNYIRLFINGALESFAVINANINFSYNGSFINKSNWAPTSPSGYYRLYSLRFTNFALYVNNYVPSNVYSPRGIPKLKTLSDDITYPEGVSCGVRYISNTTTTDADKTIIYASLSDGENVYTAESVAIDPLKWNHVKLSIFKNVIVLYVNGIAYSSETIPFDIELENVSVGTNNNTGFSGYVDNFKMYKDQTFDLEGAKYVELRPYLNGVSNSTLEDFNSEIKWTSTTTPSVVSQAGASSILGYMINTTSVNPRITSNNVTLDTLNFGVRVYIKFGFNQTTTIFKKGQVTLSLEGNTIKGSTNGTVFVTSAALSVDTLYKIDLRYDKGYVNLAINGVDVLPDPVQTTINSTGSVYYGWDGATSLFIGYLGPVSIFDNNRNRIPALDMIVEDFTTEKYYKNTVLSISSRDNVYNSDDIMLFDNSYSSQLNDVIINGTVINSTVENGFFIKKDSYLKLNSNSNFVFGTDDFTIEFNVKTSVIDRRQVILDRYFNGVGSWQVSINNDGNLYFTITDSNSSPYYYLLQTTAQTLNDGDMHKVFILRKGVNLSIYVDNVLADSFVMASVFNFNSTVQDLYIGSQRNVLNENYNFEGYLNNIRITKGALDAGTNPEEDIVERYNPTQVTGFAKTLRTFDTDVLTDVVNGNSWTNSGTSISNTMTNKSAGALHIPFGTYQTCASQGLKLSKNVDFCIEISFLIKTNTGDYQSLITRGDAGDNTLSYNVCLGPTLRDLNLIAYHSGIGTDRTWLTIPYNFEINRWYEIAICNKSGVIFFLINGIKYFPSVQLATDFYQTSYNSYIGKLNASPWDSFLDGYVDSLRVSSGTSVYTKNLGEDNAYISNYFHFTSLTENDNTDVVTIQDTGTDRLTTTISNVKSSKTIKRVENISSSLFSTNSYVKDASKVLFKLQERPFSIHTEVMLTTEATKRYIIFSDDSANFSFDLYVDVDNRLYAAIKQNGEVQNSVVSSSLVPINKWITIGLIRTSQNVLRIYVNGVVVGALNGVNENFNSDVNYYVGHPTSSFVGYMNFFKLYKERIVAPAIGENKTSVSFNTDLIKGTVLTDTWNELLKYTLSNVDTVIGIDGKYTASALFNGTSSYVKLEPFVDLNFGSEDFDIEFEIFPTDGSNDVQPIYCGGDVKFYMYGNNFGSGFNNRISMSLTDSSTPIIKSISQLYFDKWTFVRITRDGTSLKLYLDGVLDNTFILTNETFNFGNSGNIFIGKDTGTNYFKGYVSTFKLSKGDIVRSLNNSKYKVISALDFEGNSNQLVIRDYNINYERFDRFRHTWAPIKYVSNSADPILKTVTSSNEACYLQGQQGFIYKNKHTHVSFKQFTLEIRFMLTANSMSTWRRILDQSGLYALNITSDRRIEFNGGAVVLQSTANAISNNKWYHVAVTRDANFITRLFLDGVKIAESSIKQNYSEANHYPICLGMYYANYTHPGYLDNHFQGYLDNFYMINGTCKYVNNFIPNIPNDTVLANTSLAYVVGSTFTDTNSSVVWNVTNMSVSTVKVKNKTSALYSNNVGGFAQTTYSEDFKPGYEDFTIDLILCPTQVIAATTILDNRADGGLARGLVISQPTGNTSSFTVSIGSSNVTTDPDVILNTGINSISVNTYYHLRVTRNLGKIYLFLDGTLKASADYVGDIPGSGSIILANRVAKNQGFTGYLEQFRYLKRTSLAGTSFTPFTQELI